MTCTEPGPEGQGEGTRGYMHWVSRGVHTDKYTLRAGRLDPADDETHCKSLKTRHRFPFSHNIYTATP